MLPCSGFGNNARLAHSARQNNLTQYVVDLVCACVVKLVTLEVNFSATKGLGHALCEIKRRRATYVMGPKVMHLGPKAIVGFGILVLRFKLEDQWHKRFRNKPTPEITKAAILVRPVHKAVKKFSHRSVPLAMGRIGKGFYKVQHICGRIAPANPFNDG